MWRKWQVFVVIVTFMHFNFIHMPRTRLGPTSLLFKSTVGSFLESEDGLDHSIRK
jgi:hypothetical protein